MATVAVTGASGFLGAHYVKNTAAKHADWTLVAQVRSTPLGVQAPNVKPLTCDLLKPSSAEVLASTSPQFVVHMAAAITEDDARRKNGAMMRNVLEACKKSGAKLVYISSSQVNFTKKNQYALSKIEDEEAARASGIPHVILRPAAPYGPLLPEHRPTREQSMHALVKFVTKLPVVPVIGNGRYTRQPVHVNDFNAAINHFIEKDKFDGSAYDIGGPRAIAMDEIYDILSRIAGRKVLKMHIPVPVFVLASNVVKTFNKDLLSTVDTDETADNAAILAELGKEEFTSFEQGAISLF
jgi:nucleoside-diphosphate-sugar epimerase